MSHRRPGEEDRGSKARRVDCASDVSGGRYMGSSGAAAHASRPPPPTYANDRWTPQHASYASPPGSNGYAPPPPPPHQHHSSSQPYQARSGASTSGFIHPDRAVPGSSQPPQAHRPSSYATPAASSSSSYSLSSSSHPGGARPYSASSASATAASAAARAASASVAAAAKQAALEAERVAEEKYQRKMEAKMAEMEEEKTEEQLAAERAAKRAAILAKYKVQPEQPPAPTFTEPTEEAQPERVSAPSGKPAETAQPTPSPDVATVSPAVVTPPAAAAPATHTPAPALATPDTTTSVPATASLPATAAAASAAFSAAAARAAAIDAYDMFSDESLAPEVEAGLEGQRDLAAGGDLDSYDDHEGYYRYRLGDLLEGGRYRVTGFQGSGVFSTVLRVREMIPGSTGAAASTEGRELVVKLIRANDTMFAAGQKELEFLQALAANDPDNRKHTVRLLAHFMHRGHLCLVFEPLSMDLRKVIKKFGSVGLNLRAVHSYAKQLLVALRHLKKCAILHADIKPDNMLVNEAMNQIKLCDFGSASKLTEKLELTPYLVSRFYRAPELMLGLPSDAGVDLWSVATSLFELHTGKILFSGGDNNGMLKAIQDVKGRFPKRMLQRGQYAHEHFDHELAFEWRKVDAVTRLEMRQKVRYEKPTRDLYQLLRSANEGAKLTAAEHAKLKQFADFLHQCLTLDPQQRPSCDQLLQHPFIVDEP